MLNKIIDFSLRHRALVLIVTGALLVWGCIVLLRSDIDIFPDLNAPTVTVMTEAPGFAPEEVETMVTYPIETALNGAAGVRRVRSSSSPGFSVVWVEFDWSTPPQQARQTVAERLPIVAGELPAGVGTPVMGPQSSILGEIMIIGLTADKGSDISTMQLRSIADRTLRPRLLAIEGVSQVSVIGGDVEQYQIRLSSERMRYHGVTLEEVRKAAESLNTNASGGVIYDYGNEYLIKAEMHSRSIADLEQAVVRSGEGGIVTLADVADIGLGGESPRLGAASYQGTPAVLLTVTKQPKVGTIPLVKTIDERLEELAPSLPSGVNIATDIFNQSEFIQTSVSNLQLSLFEGALMVAIVLFFFMMNMRATVTSLIALPLSIILTLIILHLMGMTINTMSLGGIAIAIGSLVDDAIVDVENVNRRLRQNRLLPPERQRSTMKVIYDASSEVRLPILNSSLIIIASFLPLFFLHGMEGRMLVPLGIAFIVALAASTVVALTVTPVMCSLLSRDDASMREPWAARKLSALYSRMLDGALRRRWWVLGCTALLFVVAVGLFFTLGRSFLPPFNEGSLNINVSTLPGISLDESDHIGRIAEEIILATPEIEVTARKTGRAELDEHSLGVNVSEIEAPYKLQGRSRHEMVRDLRRRLKAIPGAVIEIGQPVSHRIDAMLSGTEAQIAVKIFGPDLEQLHNISQQVKGAMSEVPGLVDINSEQLTGRPQLDIRPRRAMLARYGITNAEFAEFISTMLSGVRVSQVNSGEIPYDIILKGNAPAGIDEIGNLMIDSSEGKIPLSYVADIVSTSGPSTISREDVSRRTVVSANVDGRDLRSAVEELRSIVEEDVKLPAGYTITYGGQFESEASASRTLLWASLGALALIMLLLWQEYHSVSQAGIILLNMPLALIGGILILCITYKELNIPAIIGFISLAGITTRNGMLLMSRYNALERAGIPLLERIRTGSADRLIPIVMTALTSSLALIPLALRYDQPGNEIQSPLAVVILGGLLTATALNVFVIPIVYQLSQRKSRR